MAAVSGCTVASDGMARPTETGEPALAPAWVKELDGVRVGFVGAVSRPGQVDGAAVTLVDELSGLPAVADRLVPDAPRPVT